MRNLPVGPLLRVTGGNQSDLARRIGVDLRVVHRWRKTGRLLMFDADRAAAVLGYHPSELWSEWWDVPNASEDYRELAS